MGFFFKRSGVVSVRMVITEEKILSNIDRIKKYINPNSKRQIIKLADDIYFKDLIDSVTTYFKEYPDKKKFPVSVYRAAYDLVEYTTMQYEENTKKVDELIKQREDNIQKAKLLRQAREVTQKKEEGWIEQVKTYTGKFSPEIAQALTTFANSSRRTDEQIDEANKIVDVKIQNLESNLFIEIDLERIEDSSKALSYIGIEIAEALKFIPTPVEQIIKNTIVEENETKAEVVKKEEVKQEVKENVQQTEVNPNLHDLQGLNLAERMAMEQYLSQTRFEEKPSLWMRFKNSKAIRILTNLFKIRIRIDYPALPDANNSNRD